MYDYLSYNIFLRSDITIQVIFGTIGKIFILTFDLETNWKSKNFFKTFAIHHTVIPDSNMAYICTS